ncbi:MAG: sulfatase-like hydrolase/transferase, partial [Candidatus Hydrogenedentota bacterium]
REAHHIRMLYAEKITMVDKWLGKVLDRLKELDLYEDTLIVFISDHGQPLGNGEHGHGIMRKCRPWPYEELVHIPLIIRHPEGIKGRVSSLVQTVDIAPTVMDFLKVTEKAEQMQGKSLLPLMRGEVEKVRDFAISGYFNFSWSIITEDWSYINWLDAKDINDPRKIMSMFGFSKVEENKGIWTCTPGSVAETPKGNELYDRRKDPFQLVNLLEKHPEIAKELFQRMRDFMIELKTS